MSNRKIKGGEIYLCNMRYALNDISGCIKPVLVMDKNDDCEAGSLYSVLPLRDPDTKRTGEVTFTIGRKAGIRKNSIVIKGDERYIRDDDAFLKRIGSIEDPELERVKELSERYSDKSGAVVLRLCPKCLRDFMADGSRIIRRLDPSDIYKETCGYCNVGLGYEYIIYTRRKRNKK